MLETLTRLSKHITPSEKKTGILWVAPIERSRHILKNHHTRPLRSLFSHEVYYDRTNEPAYARVYASPQPDHVPTLILGDMIRLAHFSFWDHTPLFPLKANEEIILGSELLHFPDDIRQLPDMTSVMMIPKLGFIRRRSTFVLTEQVPIHIGNNPAIAKIHRNIVDKSKINEFFAHIFSPDESQPLNANTHGLVFTNSETYKKRHTEIPFQSIST